MNWSQSIFKFLLHVFCVSLNLKCAELNILNRRLGILLIIHFSLFSISAGRREMSQSLGFLNNLRTSECWDWVKVNKLKTQFKKQQTHSICCHFFFDVTEHCISFSNKNL